LSFFEKQTDVVKKKMNWVIGLITTTARVPILFLKNVSGANGLFEIRVELGGNIFRIFCFFEADNKLIILNAFQKKTMKLPKQEIEKAKRLKNEYYEEKGK
jgi:phage-related protein